MASIKDVLPADEWPTKATLRTEARSEAIRENSELEGRWKWKGAASYGRSFGSRKPRRSTRHRAAGLPGLALVDDDLDAPVAGLAAAVFVAGDGLVLTVAGD